MPQVQKTLTIRPILCWKKKKKKKNIPHSTVHKTGQHTHSAVSRPLQQTESFHRSRLAQASATSTHSAICSSRGCFLVCFLLPCKKGLAFSALMKKPIGWQEAKVPTSMQNTTMSSRLARRPQNGSGPACPHRPSCPTSDPQVHESTGRPGLESCQTQGPRVEKCSVSLPLVLKHTHGIVLKFIGFVIPLCSPTWWKDTYAKACHSKESPVTRNHLLCLRPGTKVMGTPD